MTEVPTFEPTTPDNCVCCAGQAKGHWADICEPCGSALINGDPSRHPHALSEEQLAGAPDNPDKLTLSFSVFALFLEHGHPEVAALAAAAIEPLYADLAAGLPMMRIRRDGHLYLGVMRPSLAAGRG
jgi:hypothetical protein